MKEIKEQVRNLAEKYSSILKQKIKQRKEDMKADNHAHYLIYQVLGVSAKEGKLIDNYQNTGRFLYRYAGAFLEEAATLCLQFKYSQGLKTKVKNTLGERPKTFEIDYLNGTDAIEIKWRDATTDGDHITKEHTRVKVVKAHGYKPIRIMFYYPQREQAMRIQETLKTLYSGVGGEYYGGDDAWLFLKEYCGVDLKLILTEIAEEKAPKDESK